MAAITWTETYALQQPRMDETHREFVELLCRVEAALDGEAAALQQHLDSFMQHTQQHFAQEERWMAALGFEAQNCHAFQHAHVLQVCAEVRRRVVEDADVATLRLLVHELAQWFPIHAQSMDAGLAMTMAERGYDPDTGEMLLPPDPQAPLASGCGSTGCA